MNTHKGAEQGRRDDMEMIAYTLFYFLRGSLPWQGLPAKNHEERYKKVKKKKYETSLDMLSSG